MNVEHEHEASVAAALVDAIARLATAKTMRSPNQPLDNYRLPDPDLLDAFVERLGRASPRILVYEASSIRDAIPALVFDLSDQPISQEHLAIYEQIAELRASLQTLKDKSISAGYRPLTVLPVARIEVEEELRHLQAGLEQIRSLAQEAKRPDLSGLSLPLGIISVDLAAIDAVASRALRALRGEKPEVDAIFLWETAQELTLLARQIHIAARMLDWQVSEAVEATFGLLQALTLEIAATSRTILDKALKLASLTKIAGRLSRKPGKAPTFDLAIDVGTSATRIYMRARGVVLVEASLAAMRKTPRGRVLHAAGNEALPMIGRTPANIETIWLLDRGGVVDEACAQETLKFFLGRTQRPLAFNLRRTLVAVQSRGAETYRRALKSTLTAAGFSRVSLIERSLAAAIGAQLPLHGALPVMVVDIGAGSTDMAVFQSGRTVAAKTLLVGGRDLDEAIFQYCRTDQNLHLNRGSIPHLKIDGLALADGQMIHPRGSDMMQGVPREIGLTRADLIGAIYTPCRQIADGVAEFLESLPGTLRADLRTITLTGGGAEVQPIRDFIEALTSLKTHVPDDPMAQTILGCGRLLEQPTMEGAWSARAADLG